MSAIHPKNVPAAARVCAAALACAASAAFAADGDGTGDAAPRTFEAFEFLLERSPFSLPTAEEQSPAADRFTLTGAANWDGIQRVFVFDKNSQERHMLTAEAGSGQLALLEFLPDADPRKMRARVKIGPEVATISYSDTNPQAGSPQGANPQPGMPSVMPPPPVPGQPGQQMQPGQQVQPGQPGQQPPRRIIRRRVISGSPTP